MNKQLQSICQKAVEIDKLNLLVKQFLPTHLSEHCRVSSFSKGTLTVQIDDPAWATELRYSLPELRDALRKEGLYQLISVKLALANENYTLPSSNKKKRQYLSATTCSSLHALSEVCSFEPLRNALRDLANNHKHPTDT